MSVKKMMGVNMNTIFDQQSFERYINLKDTYTYNITLICRLEQPSVKYRILDISNSVSTLHNKIANILLRQIRFIKLHKISIAALLLLAVLLLALLGSDFLLTMGSFSFAVMLWYIVILIIQNEIKHHEVLVFEFVNDNNKLPSYNCFRLLTNLNDTTKLEFLTDVTTRDKYALSEDSEKYKDLIYNIKEYTTSNIPFMKVIRAYTNENEVHKMIELV